MKRRPLLTFAPRLALALLVGVAPAHAGDEPSYTVSATQLEQAVAQRFPRRYPVAGLLDFTLQAPRLRLLPEKNRLGAELLVEASGQALRRSHTGILDLDFALRYEPGDRSIRAHQLRVHALRLAGLPPRSNELLDAYGPALAEQALNDIILHQLRPQDLVLPDGMGLQPGKITVTSQGLVIGFVAKPAHRD